MDASTARLLACAASGLAGYLTIPAFLLAPRLLAPWRSEERPLPFSTAATGIACALLVVSFLLLALAEIERLARGDRLAPQLAPTMYVGGIIGFLALLGLERFLGRKRIFMS